MARQLMPRAGVVTPYVVVSRDQTIVGVTSVDGQKGPVDLTVKYLTQQNAINNYLTKADAAKTYLTQTGGTAGYLPKIKPTLPVASALLGSTAVNGNQSAIADYNLVGVVNTSSATTATIGDVRGDTIIASKTNPTIKVGTGTPQIIYHVGNKPTAADIGAANVDNQGKNTNIKYISAMDTGIDFTGGAKINQNSAQGSVYLRGVSANPEVYLDGQAKQVNITAVPAGASTVAIQLKGTTSITPNATEPNQQALRVTGRQTITADSNALSIVAKTDANAAYIAGFKADGSTTSWRIGKTSAGERLTIEKVGVGTVRFEDQALWDATKTATVIANTRRGAFEAGGHSIELGGSDAAKADDASNYYNTPSNGFHAFNNTIAVGKFDKLPDGTIRRRNVIAADGTNYEDIKMRTWGQYDGKVAPAASARASVLQWDIGGSNYLAYLQKLGNGTQEFHMNGAITSASYMTCGGGDFNVTNGAAVITRTTGDNVVLLRYNAATGFIRGYQSGTQKWYVGQTGADNCVMGNYAAGSSIALNSNKSISLTCGSGGGVSTNGSFSTVGTVTGNGINSTGNISFTAADKALNVTNGHIVVTGGGATTAENGRGSIATAGRIFASAALVVRSDRNLKKDFKKIDNAVEKLEKITGYTYGWKDPNEDPNVRSVGVVAQDVQEVLPEAIYTHDNGSLSVDYNGVIAILVNAVNELTARVKELESK